MLHKYQEIQKYIEQVHTVTVKELCEKFDISESTARRTLIELEENAIVRRIHGGGMLLKPIRQERPIHCRSSNQAEEKRAIARAAAQTVEENDVILLMSGSTVNMMAEFLQERRDITVITNSIAVVNALLGSEGVRTVFLGGVLDKRELRVSGEMVIGSLKNLRVSKVYVSAKATDVCHGLLSDNLDEISVYDAFLGTADIRYVLADHAKFVEKGLTICAAWDKIDTVVTDRETPEAVRKALVEMNIEVIEGDYEDRPT